MLTTILAIPTMLTTILAIPTMLLRRTRRLPFARFKVSAAEPRQRGNFQVKRVGCSAEFVRNLGRVRSIDP